ncbi:glycosyltransferase family 2 protein [Pedobacter duraquae]|uniref:Glycosyltransferase 2-like domain-containing protein n=1 Tax=Pedobacter duraquae TaxID=425511 RepID=A0A4R6IDS6_9SPHI|nr:glycosyltransferase family 2 protein [Pedobacter duraquae]TDO20172.1 hypothetical protein CLV32_3932 [Pedobacter duraquae]
MGKAVAIILVNWNSYDVSAGCIRSLRKMVFEDFEIILVDNASADQSGQRLKEEFPECIYLQSDVNSGFAGGNNLALRYAISHDFNYSILLNNDTTVEPDFLNLLVDYMEEHPEVGVIQPKIYFEHDRSLLWNGGSYFNSWLGKATTYGYNKHVDAGSDQIKEVDSVTGCAFMVRTKLLLVSGLLDESYFMYYEDTDLSFRIKRLGYKLTYLPTSVIYHIAGGAFQLGEKSKEGSMNHHVHYHNARNRIWIIKKFLNPWQKLTAYPYTFFYFSAVLIYFLLRWRISKFKVFLLGIKDGISGHAESLYIFNK